MNFNSYLPCQECNRSTTGRCAHHSDFTLYPGQQVGPVVSDPSSFKIVSDYGPELRRIGDALEKIARILSGKIRIQDLPDAPPDKYPDPEVPI